MGYRPCSIRGLSLGTAIERQCRNSTLRERSTGLWQEMPFYLNCGTGPKRSPFLHVWKRSTGRRRRNSRRVPSAASCIVFAIQTANPSFPICRQTVEPTPSTSVLQQRTVGRWFWWLAPFTYCHRATAEQGLLGTCARRCRPTGDLLC